MPTIIRMKPTYLEEFNNNTPKFEEDTHMHTYRKEVKYFIKLPKNRYRLRPTRIPSSAIILAQHSFSVGNLTQYIFVPQSPL